MNKIITIILLSLSLMAASYAGNIGYSSQGSEPIYNGFEIFANNSGISSTEFGYLNGLQTNLATFITNSVQNATNANNNITQLNTDVDALVNKVVSNATFVNLQGNVRYGNDLFYLYNATPALIQSVINYNNGAPKTIYIGEGEYTLTSAFALTNTHGIRIIGAGRNKTNFTYTTTGSPGHMFKLDGSNNIELAHFTCMNKAIIPHSGCVRIQSGAAFDNIIHDIDCLDFNKNNTGSQSVACFKIGEGNIADFSINNTQLYNLYASSSYRAFYEAAGTYRTHWRNVKSFNNSKACFEADAENDFLSPSRNSIFEDFECNYDEQGLLYEGALYGTARDGIMRNMTDRCISIINDVNYTSEGFYFENIDCYQPGLDAFRIVTGLNGVSNSETCIQDVVFNDVNIYRAVNSTATGRDGFTIRPLDGTSCQPAHITIMNSRCQNNVTNGLPNSECLELESSGGQRPFHIKVINNYFDNVNVGQSTPNPISFDVALGNVGLQDIYTGNYTIVTASNSTLNCNYQGVCS